MTRETHLELFGAAPATGPGYAHCWHAGRGSLAAEFSGFCS